MTTVTRFFILTVTFITMSLTAQAASVYERVMDRGTIRCGYFIEPPFTYQDPNTGTLSGLSIELTERLAKSLNLKVEYIEQISFATFGEDLKNNRYDMVCGSVFIMPRSGVMDYTIPYAYVPIHGYVKADNSQFDAPFSDINWQDVTISTLDGEGATAAVDKMLPEAKQNKLPQLSNIAEMLLSTATGKTDIAFVMPSVFADFDQMNPGKLRKAELGKPLYTYAVSFGIARDSHTFKAMINNTLTNMMVSGELEALINAYDTASHLGRPKTAITW